MELIKGKKYRVADQQGNSFVMVAANEHRLEMALSYLAGLSGTKGSFLAPECHKPELTITPIDGPAPQASAQPTVDQARYAALLEMLQAITAGIYYRQPYGQNHFDPEQAILHIRTRLAAFEKGSQQ